MGAIIRFLCTCCQSNIYFLLGMILSLCLSFFILEVEDEDEAEFLPHIVNKHNIYDHQVKLNVKSRPQKPKKAPKPFVRPRYYATELGVRDRLFVGVLTNQEHLHTRAVAINKTIAHLVDKVRYFITIPSGVKPNVTLPGIVGFTRIKKIMQPLHALKYVLDHYLENYDFYYFVKDLTYVNARQLNYLVWNLSISQDVHAGVPSDVEKYCSLDKGILLSNSIVKKLKNNLDWCVKNTFSESDDRNFGLCVLHASSVPCSNEIQGMKYLAKELQSDFSFKNDAKKLIARKEFNESITVYPINNHTVHFLMHLHFSMYRLSEIHEEIESIRAHMVEIDTFLPKNLSGLSWPIGVEFEFRAKNRFDFLRWTYFNETTVFLDGDFTTVEPLKGNRKVEVDFVLKIAIDHLRQKYNEKLKFMKLINGYWKFDATRGMDYMLDMKFIDLKSGQEVLKSVELCRPLGRVEILSVPYVTENSRIHMIVMVDSSKKFEAMKFLERYEQVCLQKKDKVSLMMVFLYDPGDGDIFDALKQRMETFSDTYDKVQAKITWTSIRLPVAFETVEIEPLLKLAILDRCLKKYPQDSLILVADTRMELMIEFLNRVRMNTILRFQIFSPIPFVEYHPDIAYINAKGKDLVFDIHRNHGRFDSDDHSVLSFYVQDYLTVRKSLEGQIPLVKTDKEIGDLLKLSANNSIESIFQMFTTQSRDLRLFRAVDPGLKFRYTELRCLGSKSNLIIGICDRRRLLQLGSKSQLARLKLEHDRIRKL